MEIFDIYDINRIKTGRTILRGEQLKAGEYHTVVHVCLINSSGQMLVQQRHPFKKGWSNMWDISCGGSCVAGETSQEGAHRELLEEIGLDISFDGVRPALTINFDVGFDDIYVLPYECEISELKLQETEVKAAKWASKDEILCMLDSGEFIPYHKCFIELLFHFLTHRGTFTRYE